jgi:hypothetical protein
VPLGFLGAIGLASISVRAQQFRPWLLGASIALCVGLVQLYFRKSACGRRSTSSLVLFWALGRGYGLAPGFGTSSSSGYRFAGGTQPWALAFAVAVIGLYLLRMYAEPAKLGHPLPGVFRRFVAS